MKIKTSAPRQLLEDRLHAACHQHIGLQEDAALVVDQRPADQIRPRLTTLRRMYEIEASLDLTDTPIDLNIYIYLFIYSFICVLMFKQL